MSVTADTIYESIKAFEGDFPVPAKYATVDVGTFDAATGQFIGLTTREFRDPEPIEHGPHDHPTNPAPRFQGEEWITETIDSRWRRTVTEVPAPEVPLAPVLLTFHVVNVPGQWSVEVNGSTVLRSSAVRTITVNLWDATVANWKVKTRDYSHSDTLKIQRPAGVTGAGVGAITIPVLPVTIIYAPPADSLGRSTASYISGQTLGTTVSFSFGSDSSQTTTKLTPEGQYKLFVDSFLKGISNIPAAAPVAKILAAISDQFGQLNSTEQSGLSDFNDSQVTTIRTITDSFNTSARIGGPGVGDVIVFYKDLRMVWAFYEGQLRLCPLSYREVVVPAVGIQHQPKEIGLAEESVQLLLDLDPLVTDSTTSLDQTRFSFQETWEYGFGATFDRRISIARDTKSQATQKTYSTETASWEPGPLFKIFGFGEKDQTTLTLSNATGTDVSSTTTVDAHLESGPDDYFVVEVWHDNLFETFAFLQVPLAETARFESSGANAGEMVELSVGQKAFWTVADKNGKFAFRAESLPPGRATLRIGQQGATTVDIGPLSK